MSDSETSSGQKDGGFVLTLLQGSPSWVLGKTTPRTGLHVTDSSDFSASGAGETAGTSGTAGAGVCGQQGEASDSGAAGPQA